MLRIVAPVFRAAGAARAIVNSAGNSNSMKLTFPVYCNTTNYLRCLSQFSTYFKQPKDSICYSQSTLLSEPLSRKILPAVLQPIEYPVRTVTKFSLKKGKRKTVKAVIKRFFRLHWGGWIRTKTGRHKKLWKKSSAQKRRLRQHVFVNATQAWLLDKMVTSYWRRPKYYVDDPYAPYHTREEFKFTRKKPSLE